MNMHSVTK